jgi:hypothetical protein
LWLHLFQCFTLKSHLVIVCLFVQSIFMPDCNW